MERCAICMQERPSLKFKTGRISICHYCVRAINRAPVSARDAATRYVADFRSGVIRSRPEAATWPLSWFEQRLPEHLEDPDRVRRSLELRLLRAHRRRLVCLDRRYLAFPSDWPTKRLRVKREDGFACHVCGDKEADGPALHVHHIIHRSRNGTNARENLVTLCVQHHQAQHPDIVIGTDRGEPDGVDAEPEAPDGMPPDDALAPPITTPATVTPPVQSVHGDWGTLDDWGRMESAAPFVAAQPQREPPAEPATLHSSPSVDPTLFKLDTGWRFWKHVLSFPVILVLIAFSIYMASANKHKLAQHSQTAPSPPEIVDPFKPTARGIAAQPAVVRSAADEIAHWDEDVAAFVSGRCELVVSSEGVRSQVADNMAMLQQALNEVGRPGMSNHELLEAAGERVYAYPRYTPRGYCPYPTGAAATQADVEQQAARSPKQKCQYTSVMSDEEIAACR